MRRCAIPLLLSNASASLTRDGHLEEAGGGSTAVHAAVLAVVLCGHGNPGGEGPSRAPRLSALGVLASAAGQLARVDGRAVHQLAVHAAPAAGALC